MADATPVDPIGDANMENETGMDAGAAKLKVPRNLADKEEAAPFMVAIWKRDEYQTRVNDAKAPTELARVIMDFGQAILDEVSTVYWHDKDHEDQIREKVEEAKRGLEPENSGSDDDVNDVLAGVDANQPAVKRARDGKPRPPSLFSPIEQAAVERLDKFGFNLKDWLRCSWSTATTTAAAKTYKELVTDKIFGAEQVTLKIMVTELQKQLDAWVPKQPTSDQITQVRPMIGRLYARWRALNAPKGIGGAVASAVEKQLDEERLDPTFKAAADAAAKIENLALAGGVGGLLGMSVPGANALFRGQWQAKGGGRLGGAGRGGGRGGGRGDPRSGRGPIQCWNCKETGHPARLCKSKATGGGDKPGADATAPVTG